MNELVRATAEHCDFYVGNEWYMETPEEKQRIWTEKFAELIIRECANHIMTSSDRHRKEHFADKVLELLE